jgi:hypothetical protein
MTVFRDGTDVEPNDKYLGVGSVIEKHLIVRLMYKTVGLLRLKDFSLLGMELKVVDTNHLSSEEFSRLCKEIEPEWTLSDFRYETKSITMGD